MLSPMNDYYFPIKPGHSDPVVEELSATENGEYTAPEGVDGYNPVTVAIPEYEGESEDIT